MSTPETPQQFAEAYGLIAPTPAPAAPMQYIEHTTRDSERWDQIAWRYYGDATNFSGIIMANLPRVPAGSTLAAGLRIVVPIIQQSNIENEDLPPWKTS